MSHLVNKVQCNKKKLYISLNNDRIPFRLLFLQQKKKQKTNKNKKVQRLATQQYVDNPLEYKLKMQRQIGFEDFSSESSELRIRNVLN